MQEQEFVLIEKKEAIVNAIFRRDSASHASHRRDTMPKYNHYKSKSEVCCSNSKRRSSNSSQKGGGLMQRKIARLMQQKDDIITLILHEMQQENGSIYEIQQHN